jgi:protein-tyrosine phosphatase
VAVPGTLEPMLAAVDTMASDRDLGLSECLNARDVGGLPLAGGGRTRRGVLLRSDALLTLSPIDAERLARLPLTTVIDLRQPDERERHPSALLGQAHLRVFHVEIWQPIHDAGRAPADPWDLAALYEAALDHAAPAFARAVDIVSQAPGATLVHCTAGKDRTGLLAALVLEAVGVDRGAVIDDYTLTHERIHPLRERLLVDAEARGIARRDFARLLGASAVTLAGALAYLDVRFGGACAYLRRAGVAEPTLGRLRARLVDGTAAGEAGPA